MTHHYRPSDMLDAALWMDRQAQKAKKAHAKTAFVHCTEIAGMLRQAAGEPSPNLLAGDPDASDEVRDVVELWNRLALPPVPKVSRISTALRRKVQTRLKAHPELGTYDRVFRAVLNDPFYRGTNDRGWTVDLAWLLHSEDRMQRILDKVAAAQKPAERLRGCTHTPPCTDAAKCTSLRMQAERIGA